MEVGVLDIQGSVIEHVRSLERAFLAMEKAMAVSGGDELTVEKTSPGIKANISGVDSLKIVRVKKPEDLEGLAGLIIPGGESTTIGKLMKRFGLDKAILQKAAVTRDYGALSIVPAVPGANGHGMAIWGTCAGAILLAKKVSGGEVEGLELMDIVVERNAYGRQLDSFETDLKFAFGIIPAVFIRGPKILSVGEGVEILASFHDEIVAVRQGKLLATTFHPEMTADLRVHQYFLRMCRDVFHAGPGWLVFRLPEPCQCRNLPVWHLKDGN